MPKGVWKRTEAHNKKNSDCHKGQHSSPATEFVKGETPWNKGKVGIYSKEVIEKMSKARIGRSPWNKGVKGAQKAWNKGLKGFGAGKKMSLETRRKISESKKGEKSYLWKGGISPLNKQIRSSIEYRLWRESVFTRDNYTCIWCKQRGGRLQADHIKPFASYPELRFAIDNGRTLCVDCHKKTDTWGGRTK